MTALLGLFLNPLFLLAVPTAGIPVILHLIHQRRAPVHFFGTIRFLKISHQKTARRKKLYDRLLLLLRALLFALLAIALAQPFLRSGASILGGKAATEAVIILDRSYSMGMRYADAGTGLSRAKQAAEAILGGLGEEDAASILLTPAESTEGQGAPGKDLEFVRAARLSDGRAELGENVRRAYELLGQSTRPNKEIYLLSDLQRQSWNVTDAAAGMTEAEVRVMAVNCGGEPGPNAAVTDLKLRGERKAVGVPIVFEARVRNFGYDRVKKVLSLYVDREKRAEHALEISGQSEALALFTYTFDSGGPHAGWVSLPEDDLETDNRRYFCVEVTPRLPVLILRDAISPVRFQDTAYYLEKALDPFRSLGQEERVMFQAHTALLKDASESLVQKYSVIFLANCREVNPETGNLLRGFVARGGGLVVFLDEDLQRQAWNEFFSLGESGPWMPLRVASGERKKRLATDPPTRLRETDLQHPLFEPFREESRHLFRQLEAQQYVPLELAGDTARVLLLLENGHPLLMEGASGQGKILVWTVGATTRSSNLPINNLFLPLVHRMVYYLAGDRGTREDFLVGQPARVSFETETALATATVVSPLGRAAEIGLTREGRTYSAVVTQTGEAGNYELTVGTEKRLVGGVAINVDARESEMSPLSDSEIRQRLPARTLHMVSDPAEVQDIVQRMREGVQLWNFFLLGVLALALFECFLANRQTLASRDNKIGISGPLAV